MSQSALIRHDAPRFDPLMPPPTLPPQPYPTVSTSNSNMTNRAPSTANNANSSPVAFYTMSKQNVPKTFRTSPSNVTVRTCLKTLPVLLRSSIRKSVECYAIIDEQSTKSFIDESSISALDVPENYWIDE